jgi:hypothetical protein
MIKYKTCESCKQTKVLGLFCINKGTKDNHNLTCLSCEKIKRDKKKNKIPGLSKPNRRRSVFVYSRKLLSKKTTNVNG